MFVLREPLVPSDAESLKRRPVAGRGVGGEELDAAGGDSQRGGGELAVVLQVEEIVADLLFTESGGRGVEVVGELPDGAEGGLLGAIAEAGQLQVLEHPLAECRGHLQVLSQRSQETPLRRTLCHGGLLKIRQLRARDVPPILFRLSTRWRPKPTRPQLDRRFGVWTPKCCPACS